MDLKLHAIFRASRGRVYHTYLISNLIGIQNESFIHSEKYNLMEPFSFQNVSIKIWYTLGLSFIKLKSQNTFQNYAKKFSRDMVQIFPSVHRASFLKRGCINYWWIDIGLKTEGAVSAKKKKVCVKKAKIWLENGI